MVGFKIFFLGHFRSIYDAFKGLKVFCVRDMSATCCLITKATRFLGPEPRF